MIGDLRRGLAANRTALRLHLGLTLWVARDTLAVGYCPEGGLWQVVDVEHAEPLWEVR